MSAIEEQLRRRVAELLNEKTVDLFIGYADADLPLKTSVRVARSAQDAEALAWNACCTSNLAALLPGLLKRPAELRGEWTPPRVGLLAKGCVSRSIVGLIKAHQIPRDALYIVGVGCNGMIDRHRVSGLCGTADLAEAEVFDGSRLRIRSTDGSEQEIDLAEVLLEGCLECRHRNAVLADETIGDPIPQDNDNARYANVEAFTERSIDERWRAFHEEISRCIRCYACREACPNCYCTECFAQETAPHWIGVTTEMSDLMLFHLGRAFHQAGRCVDCGACVVACPQGIDLRLLTQKINRDVESLFGGDVSVSLDEPEPLLQFAMTDDEGFITEP
jgi:formate dehydrogenase subunit beta